jgi:hypothetical protein
VRAPGIIRITKRADDAARVTVIPSDVGDRTAAGPLNRAVAPIWSLNAASFS